MKTRSDAWYATLEEDQLWKLYAIAKRCQWEGFSAAASAELGVEVSPSRSGYFRWLDFMRGQESERRLAQARIAALEAGELAKTVGLKDETAIAAYKSLAAEFALKSDAKTANQFMMMAMALRDRQIQAAKLDIDQRAQTTKDEQLKLAREKFEAAEKRLAAMAELSDAARGGKVDPAKVADEIDRILGRKK